MRPGLQPARRGSLAQGSEEWLKLAASAENVIRSKAAKFIFVKFSEMWSVLLSMPEHLRGRLLPSPPPEMASTGD